ncbi:MAG: DivIVA domain-containing protein [Lachnospiraceae bacterium]|nr:DivIVA domain-containing protein [Lachnospiraceae bacterium]
MLTPVDIQQKKFHVGLGYDKKDVNTFFDSVSENYESLYRSNAELKEKVSILNDTLQNYRSKESHLEKSLKRAEKDTEETITNAAKEAKGIIRDAKIQASNIVSDAEKRLEKLEDEIAVMEARYTAYKSNFAMLLKQQFEFLGEQDFDPDSIIDDRAFTLLGGSEKQNNSASVSEGFGAYTGDPQMRDESTLGGFNGGYGSGDITSTSAVYTQSLSAGENFVDPFKPQDQDQKDYNPFNAKDKASENKKSSLKVANSAEERKRMKRATVGSSEAAAAMQKAREAASQPKKVPEAAPNKEAETPKPEPKPAPKAEEAPIRESKSNDKAEMHTESAPEQKSEPVSTSKDEKTNDFSHEIPTILHPINDSDADIHVASDEEASGSAESNESVEGEVEGEVEAKPSGPARLGDGSEDDDSETDDDGFEFI